MGESPLFCWFRAFGNMRQAVASKIEEIAERVAQSEGMEVVEVEVKGGGRNHDLCGSRSTSRKASPTPIAS